jgi:hypothetical protein
MPVADRRCYDPARTPVWVATIPLRPGRGPADAGKEERMVSIGALWLPILLSAVAVFVASSLSHMVLKLHRKDYRPLANQDEAMAVLRAGAPEPGTYFFPYCADPKEAATPEMQERFKQGPVGMMNILPSGPPAMGKNLGLWFLYTVIVGVFVAYLGGRTLAPGAEYLAVFRFAGTVAFLPYVVAGMVDSIWKAQPWATTCRHMIDGTVYSLLTAGFFGWLWP